MKVALTLLAIGILSVAGCAANVRPSASPSSGSPLAPNSSIARTTPLPADSSAPSTQSSPVAATGAAETPASNTTPEPIDSGGSTTGGDIPDNAIFLTYTDPTHGFSIVYVEGWQVTPGTDGVVIRDKDSSESVQVVPSVSDVATYITGTDLPQLQALAGFALDTQDTVGVNGAQLNHLVYHVPSPPDPVTGKQVPSTIDRYYVPGPNGQLAIVSLSTPDGVDNVDAFRQMIKSFAWS